MRLTMVLRQTIFPAGGQNCVNLRGGGQILPPPRDLGNYWTDFDAENAIRRAVTRSFKADETMILSKKGHLVGQKPLKNRV